MRLRYDDDGSGSPIVLVHGHPFDRTLWLPQVRALVDAGRRAIAPDLRGYGTSPSVPGTTSMTAFARDIASLLDSLDLTTVDLCGISMGGQIVLEFCHLFPERVRSLILADTVASAETADGRERRFRTAERLEHEGMTEYARELLPTMLAPYNLDTMPQVVAHVRRMMLRTSPTGAAAALRGRAERRDYGPLLPRLQVPALVITGRDDEATPLTQVAVLHERIPDSEQVVIDDAGHLPNLERPEAFDQALLAFLNRYASPTEA